MMTLSRSPHRQSLAFRRLKVRLRQIFSPDPVARPRRFPQLRRATFLLAPLRRLTPTAVQVLPRLSMLHRCRRSRPGLTLMRARKTAARRCLTFRRHQTRLHLNMESSTFRMTPVSLFHRSIKVTIV